MIELQSPYRYAVREDTGALARLVNMAGEGLPLHVWQGLAAPGQDPWEVGRERAGRERGAFSYRNAVVREEHGEVVATLIGYRLPDAPVGDYAELPAMFVPLQQLEDLAPGSWYVNVLATLPAARGRGHGTALLQIARQLALAADSARLSIIVAGHNTGARRLYESQGYRELARRPIVMNGWDNPGGEWVLLLRDT